MRKLQFTKNGGEVAWTGDLNAVISTLRNGDYVVSIERKTTRRTLSQNALLWMWLSCIEDETGTPRNDIYNYYCTLYLTEPVEIMGRTEMVTSSSSRLDTARMAQFLDRIQAHAALELGIILPDPESRYFEEFKGKYEKFV